MPIAQYVYTVRAAVPKAKPKASVFAHRGVFASADLTVYKLTTNDFKTAQSCVNGSNSPTGVFDQAGVLIYSNLAKINAKLFTTDKRSALSDRRGFTPPKAAANPGKVRWQRKKAVPA